jgi:hypothetical protein
MISRRRISSYRRRINMINCCCDAGGLGALLKLHLEIDLQGLDYVFEKH